MERKKEGKQEYEAMSRWKEGGKKDGKEGIRTLPGLLNWVYLVLLFCSFVHSTLPLHILTPHPPSTS